MTISTVETRNAPCRSFLAAVLLGLCLLLPRSRAEAILTPWTPLYKGVDYISGTNTFAGGNEFRSFFVAYGIRVDLTDPDVRLFPTPRHTNYLARSRETMGYTVSDFLATNQLQVAINANMFDPSEYYQRAGSPMYLSGLHVSQGEVVSEQRNNREAASVIFDSNKLGSVIHTNWPATNTAGIHAAVTGMYPLVIRGSNVGYWYRGDSDFLHQQQPRTAIGLSADKRFLYLLAIDGRQAGYSDGAYDYETAGWLMLLGAHDGVNMDGGGSTTLTIQDSTGQPRRLNHPSAVANDPRGRERTVGSHLGIYAAPLPGLIDNLTVQAEDTFATVSWTTQRPVISYIEYGATTDFGNATTAETDAALNHSLRLDGLTPSTGYYYRVVSSDDAGQEISSNYFFTTTNYTTIHSIFSVTNEWKFSATNLDGVNWTAPSYDDSGWEGPGPGLLWADTRATGPNPEVGPRGLQLPANPENFGFPFVTYYFRTHFNSPGASSGAKLRLSTQIDDGAVFYLNGAEIVRLRMPSAPEVISNSQIATGYPCEGDANCTEEMTLEGEALSHLVAGDNVLAVDVHNYNIASPDMTFGVALDLILPQVREASLAISSAASEVTIAWQASGFILQEAASPSGPWIDVAGAASPFKTSAAMGEKYYRLRQ